MADKTEQEAVEAPARILSFEDIQATDDLETTEVYVKEWGGSVVVRVLTMAEMGQLQRDARVPLKGGGWRLDEDKLNKATFEKALVEPRMTAPQVEAVWAKSQTAVMTVLKAISRMNGFGTDEDAQKATQEAIAAAMGQFQD